MVKNGYGRIINLASTAGIRGGTGHTAYGAAKGAIETELVARMHSAETRRVYRAGIPLDRYGTPDETAFCAYFWPASRQAISRGIFQVLGSWDTHFRIVTA